MTLILLALPLIAQADVWRWSDADGQIHYSNVPSHVPARAKAVRTSVGYLSLPPAGTATEAEDYLGTTTSERLQQERLIVRRLQEIERFYSQVRARQVARLQSYANATLLPDWLIADQWMQMKEEEERLRAALASLRRES
jgi:hypothetical protein